MTMHSLCVTEILNKLSLPTLEDRRKISSFVMLYKIHTGKVRISLPPYITPSLRNRFSIPYSRINAHMYSLFPRTARLWNHLPADLVSSPDLEAFRAGLALHCQYTLISTHHPHRHHHNHRSSYSFPLSSIITTPLYLKLCQFHRIRIRIRIRIVYW